ncbi:MAG: DNA topoisomerase (ATP-hydrolyzing), partial [archaeon]|nr:DNA topoisomerase (ATP-hydrolyzing) [archaeon]
MAKDENMNEEENKKEIQKGLAEEEKVETAEEILDDEKYEAEVLEKETINLKDLNEDRQINAEISTEMKRSYIDYAMSVIVSRALPSAEDGLKPVHRRILYAMKLMGLEKGMTKKCARIVGDTMGKFHPHGDMAIYDALVRMAQDFSLRYPLVHGQGNFGNIDGDNAAASRYTEAKLEKTAVALLADIDKDTVKFIPNFDNSVDEPLMLPGKVPNLIINGSSGIAVGMTTNIPPHNLVEVCDALFALIDKPNITTEELMAYIKGPDFPTGGVIVAEKLKELYDTGRGGFVVRGKVTTESGDRDRDNIIITEIPYQVNKADLVKSIAELISDKKLPDVSDIRDESARGKIRVVIELKKGADSKFTINRLYKSTNLQNKFDAVMIALVNGVPQLMPLKQMLQVYIDYRRKVLRNRTKFELKEAEDREHLVQGFLIALKNINEIIEAIKKSREGILEKLMDKFKLSRKQGEAILEMKLRQLSALEHEKLKKEEEELVIKIKELKEILGDEKLILKLIKKDLTEVKKEFGDERRSRLVSKIAEFAEKDLVKKEDVIISITDKGYIKRMPFQAFRELKRGGRGVIGA